MTRVTCMLTAKNRDRLRNPTLGNRVRATFTFFIRPCVSTTTAEELDGTSSGLDAHSIPFPRPSLPRLPLLYSARVSRIPFPTPLPLPLNTAGRFGEICSAAHAAQRKNDSQLQKLWGTNYTVSQKKQDT